MPAGREWQQRRRTLVNFEVLQVEKWQVWNGAGGEGERASGMRSAFLACALGECGWWDPENKDKALYSMRGPRGSPAMWDC